MLCTRSETRSTCCPWISSKSGTSNPDLCPAIPALLCSILRDGKFSRPFSLPPLPSPTNASCRTLPQAHHNPLILHSQRCKKPVSSVWLSLGGCLWLVYPATPEQLGLSVYLVVADGDVMLGVIVMFLCPVFHNTCWGKWCDNYRQGRNGLCWFYPLHKARTGSDVLQM